MAKSLATIFFICILASSSSAQTTTFTYQGRLTDNSVPASGTYDMLFRLYDAPLPNGTQIGPDAVREDVDVDAGVFSVNLDFGAAAFANGPRFLHIFVRPGTSTGEYTPLNPRLQIAASPFAIKSLSASSADTANTAVSATSASTAATAITAENVSGVVGVANGGTGSTTKSFVDLSTSQSIAGNKNFVQTISAAAATVGTLTVTGATVNSLTSNVSATFNGRAMFNGPDPVSILNQLNVNGGITAGQFSGSGEGLTNVPGTVRWQTVTGVSQQAEPNRGYLANNSGQVTITLPATPNIGDIVRITGVGTGGWKLSQNPGQTILVTSLTPAGTNWTPRETDRFWQSIASSADGNKLVAVVGSGASGGGLIYTSTDAGVTWTPRESPRNWIWVTSSADGTKLAAVPDAGQIYVSANSGVTWTPREGFRNWRSIASSADGTKLAAVVAGGQIYTSIDSGTTWTARESARNWMSIASSSDGSKLAAGVNGGPIYTSTDSGVTWIVSGSPNLNWPSIASSADGTKLAAVVSGGQIYTSPDSGVTWTPRESSRLWRSIASSADGEKLVAAALSDKIYTSTDSGVTWTPREAVRSWWAAASSADGGRLAVADSPGRIYTLFLNTTTGTDGFLTGPRGSAVELQYIGNGQFLPLSYIGTIVGY